MALATEDLSNGEIHINRIFAKTGSRNRGQAIAYAHRHHITPPREPGR